MKRSKKKHSNIAIIIIGIIVIGLAAFFSSYYFFMHKSLNTYKTKLNFEITNINKVNTNLVELTKDSPINKERIINTMQKNISSLQNCLYAIKTLNPPQKYSNYHKNLIDGVQNNILIYKEVSAISNSLENLQVTKLNESLDSLETYINDALNYYSQVSIKGIKIDLPKETLDFLNYFKSSAKKQIKSTINTQVLKTQTSNFIDSVNDITIKFNNLKKDYIGDIKKGLTATGYSSLLNEISDAETTLSALKSNLSIVTIPNNASAIYDAFIKTIENYNSYLENLKYNLNIEQVTYSSDVINESSLEKLYESSRDDFANVEKYYENFLDLFAQFKNY